MKEWVRQLQNAFNSLSPRERWLVLGAGATVAVVLFYLIVINPLLGMSSSTEMRIATADQQLRQMRHLMDEYRDVQGRLTAIEQRIQAGGARGNLRTTLETLARQATVKIEAMEPQASPANERYREEKVEVDLSSVTLAQTVNYLHQIESAPQVLSVKSLRIRTRPDRADLLDVTFTVSSFEPI